MPIRSVPIERVEKTNMIVINLNQQAQFVLRCNSYVIEIDYERNKKNLYKQYSNKVRASY